MPTTTFEQWLDELDRLLCRRWNRSVLDFDYPFERRHALGFTVRSTFFDLLDCS